MIKYVYILFILFGLNFTTSAQSRFASNEGPVAANTIKFYPNPASSAISFEFNKDFDKSYNFQVYNFMGKKVYDIKKMPNRIILNLEDFFRGVYIFQLRDKNGTIIQSGKFQVVK